MKLERWQFEGIDGMNSPESAQHWKRVPEGKWALAEEVTRLTLDVIQLAEYAQGLLWDHRYDLEAGSDVKLSLDYLEQIIQRVDQTAPAPAGEKE